jgi:hypothetical protein
LFLASVLSFLALSEAKIDLNRAHHVAHPTQGVTAAQVKSNFKSKVVSSVGASPTTYFVVNEFNGIVTTCDGYPNTQVGFAFGSCIQNSESTTAKYSKSTKDGYYITTLFNSTDCSGDYTSVENSNAQVCFPNTDGNTYSFTVVESSTPWKYHTTQGIASLTFYSDSSCGGSQYTGSGDTYSWIAQGQCLAMDDGNYFTVNSCHGSYFGYQVFSDAACQTRLAQGTDKIHWCEEDDDNYYEMHECTAGP